MTKKIILLLAIAGPFIAYFFYTRLMRLNKKKYPIKILLLIVALGLFRFYDNFSPNTKYTPAKYEDGKLVPAENK